MGLTDGYTDFHEKTPLGFKVPSGLTDMLIEVLGEWQNQQYFEFTYMDNRPDPILLSSDVKFPIQVGTKTLRDYQEEAVIASLDNLTGIIKHSTNCVTGDTLLYTDKGLKTFDEVIEENDIDTSQKEIEKPNTNGLKVINRYGEIEEPSHLMYNGVRDTYEIKMDNGNKIKATKEHPLMVVNTIGEFEWKKVNDIVEGDYIVSLKGSNLGTETKLTKDEAYLLGLIIADGFIGSKNKISITNNQEEILKTFYDYFTNVEHNGSTLKVSQIKDKRSSSFTYTINNKSYVEHFHNKLGIGYGVAKDKEVPKVIMQATKEVQLSFLSGYLESEMFLDANKLAIEVSSASEKLLLGVQQLLNNLGYNSRISQKQVKKYPDTWYGILTMSAKETERLISNLTFITKTINNKVDKFYETFNKRSRINKNDSVPYGKSVVKNYVSTLDIKFKDKKKYFDFPRTISRDRFREGFNFAKGNNVELNSTIEQLLDEKYTFNKVTSKTYYGKEKTYDLHVPGTHSFIANGIINHNSGKTSSALGLIQELLPHTEKDERIAFFTESTAIFNQVYTEFSETLDVPVGRWGAGKKDIKKVTVVMVQTIYAGVKADPEKGLKLTPKQRIQKKMTKEILPIIENTVNPKLVLQNFVSTFKVKSKADQDFLDEVNEVIKKSESGAKAKFHVNKYGAEYQKIVKKKAEKVYKKNKEAMDFLESLVGFIVDECLVEDTLITKLDGTQDYIKNFKVGDEIVGDLVKGKAVIEDIKVTEKETIKIEHENGHISGSLTHPTYVVKANGDGATKILPFMAIEVGDYLINYEHEEGYTFSKVTNITETGKQTVYDFTTSTHTFIADNTLTANCHHTKSDSFYKTFLHAENAIYRIGLTGSIDQNDPMLVQRLRATFSKVISETRNSQMIERGISAKPTIYFSTIEHVLNDIEEELPNGEIEVIKNEPVDISLNKNYMDSYDKGIVKNNYRNTVIAKISEINYNKGRGVLVILNRIEHGDSISHMLDTLGIPHAFVQGEMEVEEREKHFTDMKQGKLKVLISTSLMDEGVDISGIDALIMGAGGKSLRQVLQRIGRGLRYKDDGENKLYVYDFTDRVNDFLFSHYKQRREIYEEEGFDIVDL